MRRPLQQLHAKRSAHDPEFASSRAITDKAIPGHPLSFHALAILGLTCITASALQAPAHAAPAHAIPAHAIPVPAISVFASPAPTAAAPAATVLAAVALGVPVPAAPASATAVPVAAAHAAPTPAFPGPALQDDLPASPAELALPPLRPHQPKRPAPIVLNCGARLLLIEDDSLPLVDGTLLFPGGSVHEDERQSGLTAILAETLRQGGSKTLSGAELDTWLDRHAVELSIAADAEFLRIQFSCLAEDLGETLAVIGDLLARPAYPEEDLERVRLQYLTALARRADDADSLASEVIEMLAFGSDSPWARQPTPESLAAVDRESLVRFHRLHIAKNRAILGLSGSLALALAVGANGEAAGAGESAAPGTPNAPDKSDGRVNQPAGSDGSSGSGGSDGSDGSDDPDDFKGPNGSKGSNNPNGSKDSSGPNAPRVSKATPGNPTAAPAIPGTPSAANESAAADENSHQPSQALLDLLDATLAPLPEAQGELPSPPRPFSQPRLTRVHILDRPGVPQTELRLAAPGVRRLDPDYSALRLWSSVVGSGGMTSRLMMHVRTELGLAYSVGAFFGFGWGQAGRLYAWCGTRNEAVGQALAAIMDVLEDSRAPFPADELEAFRRRAINKGVFFNDTPAELLSRTLYLLAQDYPADFDDRWPVDLRKLTAAELSAAATRHLDTGALIVLAVGPAEEIRQALFGDADTDRPFFIQAQGTNFPTGDASTLPATAPPSATAPTSATSPTSATAPTAATAPRSNGADSPASARGQSPPRLVELVFVDEYGRPTKHEAPPAAQPPLVDELLAALGGRAAWAAANYMEAEISMILPDGRELPSHQWKDLAQPRLRQTITMGGVDRTTVLSKGEAWTRAVDTLTQLEPETAAQMIRAHERGLWNLLHRLAARTTVTAVANPDGSLQLATPAGFTGRLDLDESQRPKRLTFTESGRRQIYDFSEYKTENGLTYPALAKQSPLGTAMRIKSLRPHQEAPEGTFARP